MKKFAALLLAVMLMVTCAVSAMASASQWVDVDLDGYNVVYLFNYNESVALATWASQGTTPYETWQAVNPDLARMETAPQCGGKSVNDIRYVVSSVYVAGFEANEVVGNGKTLNVVPVDLTVEENTAFVYPIATKSHVIVGLLYVKVNVEDGSVIVEPAMKHELYAKKVDTLNVYTSKTALTDGEAGEYAFGSEISIEEDLEGAPAVLVAISGKVTYPTLFGNIKSGITLSYQDYYRNERWARSYRTAMTPALRLVAD